MPMIFKPESGNISQIEHKRPVKGLQAASNTISSIKSATNFSKHARIPTTNPQKETEETMAEQDYQNGLKVRTEVMGAAFVERAQNNTTELTQPLQDWINEHAWGSTWQREGVLERKTRSLITLAMLTALKCPTELKGHIRGAINNGCTVAEIQETLLHSLPYCGAPAAQEAFRAAQEVLDDIAKQP